MALNLLCSLGKSLLFSLLWQKLLKQGIVDGGSQLERASQREDLDDRNWRFSSQCNCSQEADSGGGACSACSPVQTGPCPVGAAVHIRGASSFFN